MATLRQTNTVPPIYYWEDDPQTVAETLAVPPIRYNANDGENDAETATIPLIRYASGEPANNFLDTTRVPPIWSRQVQPGETLEQTPTSPPQYYWDTSSVLDHLLLEDGTDFLLEDGTLLLLETSS
jgi:hypothetical protein